MKTNTPTKQDGPTQKTPHASLDADLIRRANRIQDTSTVAIAVVNHLATRAKGDENRQILAQIAEELESHRAYLEQLTGHPAKPHPWRTRFRKAEANILGMMFAIRKLLNHQDYLNQFFAELKEVDEQADEVYERSIRHENALMDMLDEERLHYIGAMVLGLNDALVEITGALAGVTFSLCNTKVVALTGIVTGISATISMAASNYLAVKEDGSNDAVKSGAFTGGAYFVAVILLVLPYLLLPDNMYAPAFFIMLAEVIIILVAFNYYLSVANNKPFWKRFGQMAVISLGVALIAFLIGLAAKELLGITIA